MLQRVITNLPFLTILIQSNGPCQNKSGGELSFLKADCIKELSPEIYVSVKERRAHQALSLHLLPPLVSLSLK